MVFASLCYYIIVAYFDATLCRRVPALVWVTAYQSVSGLGMIVDVYPYSERCGSGDRTMTSSKKVYTSFFFFFSYPIHYLRTSSSLSPSNS